jgi:hypothetical protein
VNTTKVPVLSALYTPEHIKPTYSNLVLISHPRHISKLDLDDDDTLIVSSDWLVWRQIIDQGGHCLHLEAMLGDYDGSTDFFIKCSNWVYVDNIDVTEFSGMSLGKAFNREIELFLLSFDKTLLAIKKFCSLYQIEKIILYDIRGDYGLIDSAMKQLIVETAATSFGIDIEIKLDEPPDSDPAFHDAAPYGVTSEDKGIRAAARQVYSFAIDLIFQLKWLSDGCRNRVFILVNLMMMESLIKYTPTSKLAPIASAEGSPKSWKFLRACWKNGGYLGSIKSLTLTSYERELVFQTIEKLSSNWASIKPDSSSEAARRHYISTRIFESDRLYKFAEMAKSYKEFLRRKNIKSIIVSDATSFTCRLVIEAARALGLDRCEILNGMFVHDMKYDVRCGDEQQSAALSRLFAWGEQQKEWLKRIGSKIPCVQTGYPGIDMIRATDLNPVLPSPEKTNVLVLPCYIVVDNIRGIKSNSYMLLVDMIRTLKELGYKNVRIKLHPGLGGMGYVQRLITMHNLDCELFIEGSVPDHMNWADFIVGPVESGSMVEALAGGIPYFGFAVPPSNVDKTFFGTFPVLETVDDLRKLLETKSMPESKNILSYLCDTSDFQKSSPKVWQTLISQ